MINKKSLEGMKKKIEEFDEQREVLIKASRDVLRFSKQTISTLQRNDIKEAEKLMKDVEKTLSKCREIVDKDMKLQTVGAYSEALQEYTEAKTLFGFLKGKIPETEELKVPYEDYLMGLCDLTGELSRMAVISAINSDNKKVQKIRDVVDEIYVFFCSLDMRNGELRKKADAIKWNLKKIEEVLYDLKIKRK